MGSSCNKKGNIKVSRITESAEPDVLAIRKDYKMSQRAFFSLLGICKATLQNWEQGRRKPQDPAKVLHHIVAKYPKVLVELNDGGPSHCPHYVV